MKFLVKGDYSAGFKGRRVEINAMTSEQLIDWLEMKFKEHGIMKYIPDQEALKTSYRRARYLKSVQDRIDEIELEHDHLPVPDNMEMLVEKMLQDNPVLSWDEAIWELQERQNRSGNQ